MATMSDLTVEVTIFFFFFFQAEDGRRVYKVTGVQTCALPISRLGHTTPSASVEIELSRWASPPFAGITQICDFPPRVEMKAMDWPSGDQRGRLSEPSPCVNWRAAPPSAGTSQMWPAFLFASKSAVTCT